MGLSKRRNDGDSKPPGGSGTGGSDPISKVVRAVGTMLAEVLKLGREMLVIPAQLWMLAAEFAGGLVLRVWRSALVPLALLAWRFVKAAYRFAEAHVTPARAVAAVAITAAVVMAVGQWSDYRAISVGSDAYAGGIQTVAPAPEIVADRAGEAHSWALVPIAVLAALVTVVALTGRARAARLLVPLGIAAIAIAVLIDAPKGLDEGSAARDYEGAKATLLDGFWIEIATGAVLVACGLLLPRYLRPAAAREQSGKRREPATEGPARVSLRMPRIPGRPKGSSA